MIALLTAALLFAVACGDGDDDSDASGDGGNGDSTPQVSADCAGGQVSNGKQYSSAPPMTIDTSKTYTATIKTDVGDMKLELFAEDAPNHVNNFVFLAREGFYDCVVFHRVIANFMAQSGDPTGTGGGGPGYTLPLEINDNKFEEGTLGMARTNQPDTAGSQWFICFQPQPDLDGGYTTFGKLIEGRDVLGRVAIGQPPSQPTVINTIDIEES
jgi:cyclophilin family peptidyl-prolyl cis-trans isomerase